MQWVKNLLINKPYPDYQEEDEEEENLFGCARSDPNEPVSEKPLYDYLWPKEIAEEEDKVLYCCRIPPVTISRRSNCKYNVFTSK